MINEIGAIQLLHLNLRYGIKFPSHGRFSIILCFCLTSKLCITDRVRQVGVLTNPTNEVVGLGKFQVDLKHGEWLVEV